MNNKHLEPPTPAVSLNEFKASPFVLLRSGNDTRERSDQLFKGAHVQPDIVLELDQQVTAYHVACYGMGITFISDTLVRQVPVDYRVTFYKLDEEIASRCIFFYHKHTRYITRAMQEFLNMACRISNSETSSPFS